ncbi:hypothetical protein H6503_01245 [Candidatus Woesearchaeota archaeon]|nr:hypothetical protein [Candidatus Woesearchaeota archaeon]
MAFESMVSMAEVVFMLIVVYAFWRKIRRGKGRGAEVARIKDSQMEDRANRHLMEDEQKFVQIAPKVEAAEKKEEHEMSELSHIVDSLHTKVQLERTRIVPIVQKMLAAESHEHLKEAGEGIPEAGEIEKICTEENHLIDMVWKLLLESNHISKRVVDFVSHEDKVLHKDIHKIDVAERELKAEGGESHVEAKRVHEENREIRREENELEGLMTIEKKILHELQSTRRKCRFITHMNDDVIRLVRSHKDRVSEQKAIAERVGKDIHRKADAIADIVLSVKVLQSYEKDAIGETEKAIQEARKVEKA